MKELYIKFKHLLEYFVTHLEYAETSSTSIKGYLLYIDPIINDSDTRFLWTGYGWKGDGIQNQISKWDKYDGYKLCISIAHNRNNGYTTKSCYLNWEGTWLNIRPQWGQDKKHITDLYISVEEGANNAKSLLSFSIDQLGLFDGLSPNDNIKKMFNKYYSLIKDNEKRQTMQQYIRLLKANKNIILTGAPGTGKTYLAKKIAKAMDAEYKLVQFHPSYDYTDFVEGLRPVKSGSTLGFQRKDGVFKTFCKDAINFTSELSFDSAYTRLVENIKKGNIKTISLKTKESTELEVRGDDSIGWYSETEKNHKSSNIVSRARLKQLFYVYNTLDKLDELQNINNGIQSIIGGCDSSYYWGVLHYLLENNTFQSKPYVLIIDEINRGEISKIFGELFLSIDTGYRGEEHKVDTQYQNLIPREEDPDFDPNKADVFRNGFFIPENVYIIGTMNDIDRSVESMDFAMRRRFAWKEITVKSRQSMLDEEDAWGINGKPSDVILKEMKSRMDNLNAAIIDQYGDEVLSNKDKIGLSKAYQIGASYFLKYSLYDNFDDLWTNHIEGLLYEYLRGKTNIDEKIERLHQAYNDTTQH